MVPFLGSLCIVSYTVALIALAASFTGGTDIQMILAGVYGTFGTVACVGRGVITRLNLLIAHRQSEREGA